ncbi:ShlB/FhaC/HecB family hemolysin secretion/activation protein [Aquimarina rhabdastrellae]
MFKEYHLHTLLFIGIYFLSINTFIAQDQLYLNITGNSKNETKLIDSLSYKKSHENYISIKKELTSLQEKLFLLGYIDLELFEKKQDSIYELSFLLNKRYNHLKLNFAPNTLSLSISNQFKKNIKDDHIVIKTNESLDFLNNITDHYVNTGSPFSTIQVKKIHKQHDTIIGSLHINITKQRILDHIIIRGYKKFPLSYLKYYAKIKSKTLFDKKAILSKTLKIDNLPFSKNIKSPDILFTKDSTQLFLYLKKIPSNNFEGFLGFTTNSETNKIEFTGNVNLSLYNNLNYGEKLQIIYRSDGREQQLFNINTHLPYIFKSPIGLKASLEIFKKDSSFVSTQQNLGINYNITPRTEVTLGYKNISSSNLLNTIPSNNTIQDLTASYFTTEINYLKEGNSLIKPKNIQIHTVNDFGQRKNTSNSIFQFRNTTSLVYTLPLNNRNALYLNNITGYLSSEDIFENELFRFGGINSIRGFEENSIPASFYNVIRSEYRYLLSSNLYVNSIIDYAYFEEQTSSITQNLTSFGIGLGLKNKTGLFKIIFANGKSNNQNFSFSNTKIHIKLITKF